MKYLLYGLGKSNQSVKKYFDNHNYPYEIYIDGVNEVKNLFSFDLIVKSPGIVNNTYLLKNVKKNRVVTDLELFYRLNKSFDLITITGSNGKTTVTSLIEKVLNNFNYVACGNIGIPIFDYIDSQIKGLIVEASSFMLEYCKTFKPRIFVILNIEKHHLSHHLTFDNYLNSKLTPLKNMTNNDIIIYNYDDLIIKNEIIKYNCKKYSFSLNNKKSDCYLDNNYIYYNNKKFMSIDKLKLIGFHNIKNILASILVFQKIGFLIEDELIISSINNFQPLEHRLEKFLETSDLIFINDSKSTNPFATKEAIDSVKNYYKNKDIILIMGGKNENYDYSILLEKKKFLKKILLYGENKEKIKEELLVQDKVLSTIDEIINSLDVKNSVVLFSPGAPSYDQFQNFEERGTIFKNLIFKKYMK